ncbi:MAG: copper-translocating P-type ATPase [Desulfovibrio sp. MES5]|uniref:heavy metal translocating P-type ATPase n=1 Tax=Desulfovibrio sp. MES5 TaxID=1899016 RepID=UPI000B9C8CCB|nr:cation-translocating P-type ATPase [Desulfovibrio sp. MES5]OXS30130.1 MAG: copper-translocating P-type ATPase [Desulfovibrio sp. MES5]
MKTLFNCLSGTRMTLLGGAFLAASLVILLGNISVPLDPAWVTVFICGFPLVYLALTRVFFERRITSALLISIAMFACIYIGELFAAGEVAFIMAVGAILEERTVEKAKKGIKELISLVPLQGRRLTCHGETINEEMIAVESIRCGDLLRILPGETIPVDGTIRRGNTSIDQSAMTGEFLPVDKAVGEDVFSGTINRFGTIDIEAARIGEDSSLQKLVSMVQEAENSKAPMQRIVDKWAAWLVPIAMIIAMGAYAITNDIVRAVTVLVVFCPCALALATPTSIMAAIGQATRQGVLIKSGEALENMGKVDRIAFDKTGTLTHGTLVVSDIISFLPEKTPHDLMQLAASVEALSEHPLGKAMVAHAREKNISLAKADGSIMTPGKGISATVGGVSALMGNIGYLQDNAVDVDKSAAATLENLRKQGKAVILVALDGVCAGAVAFSDTLRTNAQDMVKKLHDMGTGLVLLTGDHAQTASYFSERAGIDLVYSELLPAQKVEHIRTLQQQGHVVCMIGDGVNDAPALKTADVGVAMGSMGSDIAIDAADMALMGDDITKIPYLKRLSDATVNTIKFNITLSMAINLVAISMSVMGLLNPITGALVHNAGSVLVVLNAARLYERKLMPTAM